MKRLIITIILMAIAAGCGGGQSADYFSSPYYLNRLSDLDNFQGYCDVIFIGDSRVHGGGWEEYNERWCDFGIGGDTTTGVLNRIQSIMDRYQSKIVLQIGYNDTWGKVPVENIALNVNTIADRFTEHGSEVYITSILPSSCYPDINYQVESVNYLLSNHENYIDLNEYLAPNGLLTNTSYDCQHLNDSGYDIIYEIIEQSLQALE